MLDQRQIIVSVSPKINGHLTETDRFASSLATKFDGILKIIEKDFAQKASFSIAKIRNEKNYKYNYFLSFTSASKETEGICNYAIDQAYDLFWVAVSSEPEENGSGRFTTMVQNFIEQLTIAGVDVYAPVFEAKMVRVLGRIAEIVDEFRGKMAVSVYRSWIPTRWPPRSIENEEPTTGAVDGQTPVAGGDPQMPMFQPLPSQTLPKTEEFSGPSGELELETLLVEVGIIWSRNQFVLAVYLNGHRIYCQYSPDVCKRLPSVVQSNFLGTFTMTFDPSKNSYYVVNIQKA